MVSCNIYTLTFSSVSFYFFQVTMHCLYCSHISCSYFIYYNNPYFPPSTMVNLVFNDLTSKPKLPIFWFTIAIARNIYIVLLLPNTSFASSSTILGVKFCGVSCLKASFDDNPLSLIYKPKSISNPYPFDNPNLLCGSTTTCGPKLLNVDYNTTICGSWDGCGCCCSISGCVTCTSIGAYWWTSIYAWKSYKSSTSSYCMCSCWFSNVAITWGNLLLSDLICYNCSFLSWSCSKLWSLSSLDGICLVTLIVVTHVGLIFLCMTF
jgi:hypothetical protein